MITVKNAQIYSTNGEMAYEVEYSDGTKIRAVESPNSIIRSEYERNGKWKMVGKPYVVVASKKRNAERTKEAANSFLQ